MPLAFALIAYALSMTVANLLIARFGPGISPVLAFFLIGMDLALRDWLHVRLRFWQMGALIAVTGMLTWALNPAAGQIAVASTLAFTGAAVADWLVFTLLRGRWLFRANASNVAGAAVDSVLFPTLAFGSFMPGIVLLQFAAKVAGGALWSWALSRGMRDASGGLKAQG
jgi:uncharacterized PurR-regulated membrane protein YhhQ (DUF165 family)